MLILNSKLHTVGYSNTCNLRGGLTTYANPPRTPKLVDLKIPNTDAYRVYRSYLSYPSQF